METEPTADSRQAGFVRFPMLIRFYGQPEFRPLATVSFFFINFFLCCFVVRFFSFFSDN